MALVNQGDSTENTIINNPIFLKYSTFFSQGIAKKLNNKIYSNLSLTAKDKKTIEI